MMDAGSILITCSWIAVGFASAKFLAHRRETRVLRELLQFRFGPDWNGRIETIEQVREIKRLLNERVTHRGVSKSRKRSLLRDSAIETLALGKGYCGENSRVAVRLLTIGGLRANRLYLSNGHWGHVVCEFCWEGGTKMFDGHIDPVTHVPDEVIGLIASEDIAGYPNDSQYPWIDFFRIKLFSKIAMLHRFSKKAVPYPLAYHFESPALICCYLSLLAALTLRISASII